MTHPADSSQPAYAIIYPPAAIEHITNHASAWPVNPTLHITNGQAFACDLRDIIELAANRHAERTGDYLRNSFNAPLRPQREEPRRTGSQRGAGYYS